MRQVFTQTDAAAHVFWCQMADQLRSRFPRVAVLMDEAEDDVLAYLGFPEDIAATIANRSALTDFHR